MTGGKKDGEIEQLGGRFDAELQAFSEAYSYPRPTLKPPVLRQYSNFPILKEFVFCFFLKERWP